MKPEKFLKLFVPPIISKAVNWAKRTIRGDRIWIERPKARKGQALTRLTQALPKIVILIPHGARTGGPEALFQLSDALIKQGFNAECWLVRKDIEMLNELQGCSLGEPIPSFRVTPRVNPVKEYDRYEKRYFSGHQSGDSTIFVIPELWAWAAPLLRDARCAAVIWWLSVDNAFSALARLNLNAIRHPQVFHASQSHYSSEFLGALGLVNYPLTDYTVAPTAKAPKPIAERKKQVAFNAGSKVLADLNELEAQLHELDPDIQVVRIAGMSRDVVYSTLCQSRLYLDLGNFPGKDRMPREASILGTPSLISRTGAGSNGHDFLVPDSNRADLYDIPALARRIIEMLQNPTLAERDLAQLQAQVLGEKTKFFEEAKQLFSMLIASRSWLDAPESAP